jgi:hypothetical protein
MFRRKNDLGEMIYYLIHPGYEHDKPRPEGTPYGGDSFRYSMGSTPLGNLLPAPVSEETDHGMQTREHVWDYKGSFFDPTGCDTSHGSAVEFRNKYYFVYHTQDLSGHGTNRSVCIEEFDFNPDGTIIPFAKSKNGVKQNGPDYIRPKGVIYDTGINYSAGSDIIIENIDGGNGARARFIFNYSTPDDLPKMEFIVNGISYSYINFIKTCEKGGTQFFAEAEFTPRALNPGASNKIELRKGGADTKGTVFVKHIEVILFGG